MTERERILQEMAIAIREAIGLDHVEWEQWLEVADAALRVIETPPSAVGKTYGRCTCGNDGYSEHSVDCEMYHG